MPRPRAQQTITEELPPALPEADVSAKAHGGVPAEWKAARAARAQAWFTAASDECAQKHLDALQRVTSQEQQAHQAAARASAVAAAIHAHDEHHNANRLRVHAAIAAVHGGVSASSAPPEHVLRWPRHTPLRPIVVVGASPSPPPTPPLSAQSPAAPPGSPAHPPTPASQGGRRVAAEVGFKEQLYVRGLVSTLLAHAQVDSASHTSHRPPALGWPRLTQPGCAGADLVWWEGLHSLDSIPLARLEALRQCAVAVMVLSSSYACSQGFGLERDLLLSRLASQGRPLLLLVLRYSDNPLEQPPALARPPVPEEHPLLAIHCMQQLEVQPQATCEEQIRWSVLQVANCIQASSAAFLQLPITFSFPGGLCAGAEPTDTATSRPLAIHFHPTTALAALGPSRGDLDPTSLLRHSLCTPALSASSAPVTASPSGSPAPPPFATLANSASGRRTSLASSPMAMFLSQSPGQDPRTGLGGTPTGILPRDVLRCSLASAGLGPGASWVAAHSEAALTADLQASRASREAACRRPFSPLTTLLPSFLTPGEGPAPATLPPARRTTPPSPPPQPSSPSLEPGLSGVGLLLPPPGVSGAPKSLLLWGVHDVQMWVSSLGRALTRFGPPLLHTGVDGQLLLALTGPALEELSGQHDPIALKAFMEAHARLVAAVGIAPHPVPGWLDDPLLLTRDNQQLGEVFLEVMQYYDQDQSGDLDEAELACLLQAAGLQLSGKEVRDICQEYDTDRNSRLSGSEGSALLWDLWRLMVAGRDATAWNPPARLQLLSEARGGGTASQASRPESAPAAGSPPAASYAQAAALAAQHLAPAQGQRQGRRGRSPISHTSLAAGANEAQVPVTPGAGDGWGLAAPWAGAGAGSGAVGQQVASSTAGWGPGRRAGRGGRGAEVSSSTGASTAATSLEVFKEPALAQARSLRPGLDPSELAASLHGLISRADLRRSGPLPASELRAALAAHYGPRTCLAAAGPSALLDLLCPPPSRPGQHQPLRHPGSSRPSSSKAAQAPPALQPLHHHPPTATPQPQPPASQLSTRPSTRARPLLPPPRQGSCQVWAAPGPRPSSSPSQDSNPGPITWASSDLDLSLSWGSGQCEVTPRELHLLASLTWAPHCTQRLPGSAGLPAGWGDQTSGARAAPQASAAWGGGVGRRGGAAGGGGGAGTGVGGDGLVDRDDFVARAVEAVAASQQALLDAVYAESGTQRLLYRLHAQVYPGHGGFLRRPSRDQNSGPGAQRARASALGDEACLPQGLRGEMSTSSAAVQSLSSSVLVSTAVPFDEAPLLLATLSSKLGVRLPLLVQAGILQEAAAEAERVAGTGIEVTAWSTMAAHMLHVWQALQQPPHA